MTDSVMAATVPLGRLVPSKMNVRRVGSEVGLGELAASISAHGLIQNLVVRRAGKGKAFEVVAGGRRLGALRRLMKDGGSVLGVAVDKDFPVRVVVQDAGEELSLAENVQREAMHPVDEVEAFGRLVDGGMGVEDVAARFGQSVVTVRQRLKLAALSPRVLNELRSGEMTLEQARALAISDDHAAQEAVWFGRNGWSRNPANLRAALTSEHVRATDRLVRFVGLEAYEAAGGAVVRDLFGDEDEAYLADRELLVRLATEKLAVVADELREHHWKWVDMTLESGLSHGSGYGRIHPARRAFSDAEQAELEQLAETFDQLEEELEGFAEGDDGIAAVEAKQAEVEQRVERIRKGAAAFVPEEQALAGCLVGIGYAGQLQVVEGLVKAEDRRALAALQAAETPEAGDEPADAPQGRAMAETLVEELTAVRTAALRVELTRNPAVALAALLYPLAVRLFFGARAYGVGSAVELSGKQRPLAPAIREPDGCRALAAWEATLAAWQDRLPAKADDLWDWLLAQPQAVLLELLAAVAAANLNAVKSRQETDGGRLAQADAVAGALGFDISGWWSPDAAFLSRLSKAEIAAALREAGCGEEAANTVARGAKAEAVTVAAQALDGTGWLPGVLRPKLPVQTDEVLAEAA